MTGLGLLRVGLAGFVVAEVPNVALDTSSTRPFLFTTDSTVNECPTQILQKMV